MLSSWPIPLTFWPTLARYSSKFPREWALQHALFNSNPFVPLLSTTMPKLCYKHDKRWWILKRSLQLTPESLLMTWILDSKIWLIWLTTFDIWLIRIALLTIRTLFQRQRVKNDFIFVFAKQRCTIRVGLTRAIQKCNNIHAFGENSTHIQCVIQWQAFTKLNPCGPIKSASLIWAILEPNMGM